MNGKYIHSKKTLVLQEDISHPDSDYNAVIKISGRIIKLLREIESRLDIQEELLLELRNQSKAQNTFKEFEPIRGIHGLAEFLGVSPVTAQKIKNSGKIPFVQYERVILFDPEKVMEALEKKVKNDNRK